jgi:hypothetical protein
MAGKLRREHDLTEAEANAVYDILIQTCGALKEDDGTHGRSAFMKMMTQKHWNVKEFRFCGALGYGGKIHFDGWELKVSCYPENMNPQRRQMIEMTNGKLKNILKA